MRGGKGKLLRNNSFIFSLNRGKNLPNNNEIYPQQRQLSAPFGCGNKSGKKQETALAEEGAEGEQGVRGRGRSGKSCTLDKVADAAGCCCLLFLPNIRHAVHVAVQHTHPNSLPSSPLSHLLLARPTPGKSLL